MQDLDQNMDEQFRRAAENYPLKTDESGWEDIAPSLANLTAKPSTNKKAIFRKYIVPGMLLLLLSLVIADSITTRSLKKNISSKTDKPVSEKNSAAPASTYQSGGNINRGPNNAAEQPLVNVEPIRIDAVKRRQYELSVTINGVNPPQEKISFYKMVLVNKLTQSNDPKVSPQSDEKLKQLIEAAGKEHSLLMKEQAEAETNIRKIGIRQRKGPYLGAVAGPLFDEVKNQGLKKTGFSIGMVAGWRFNNHLSLETGLLFANKPYFSTGIYFNMDKISSAMPQGMQILSLEGKNNVLEIPVRIKYDFLHRAKHHFFSSAGISSYITTNEENNYLVAMNSVQQTMTSSYKNRSRSAAATLDFSAGYELKIGKTEHIRIEPYIQFPLEGMGVGSLPMNSSGIRLGITKFFN